MHLHCCATAGGRTASASAPPNERQQVLRQPVAVCERDGVGRTSVRDQRGVSDALGCGAAGSVDRHDLVVVAVDVLNFLFNV